MKIICSPIFSGVLACAMTVLPALSASAQSVDCAAVAERVATAVKANPDQVLTVVEDALVAYEECACEVVSAAIKGSKGGADMVKKIVLVAVQTAETQAPGIAECAVAAAPEHAEAVRVAFAEAFNGKQAPAVAATENPPASETEPVADTDPAVVVDANADTDAPVTAAERAAQEWSGKEVVVDTLSGKEPVYGDPGYSPENYAKAPIVEPEREYFGAAPLPIGMAFLIPPVSASPIIFEDEDDDEEVEVKIKRITRTRIVRTPSPPEIITRTVPVSPTSP